VSIGDNIGEFFERWHDYGPIRGRSHWRVAAPDAQHSEWRVINDAGFHIWKGDDAVEARRNAAKQNKGRGFVGVLLRILLVAEYVLGFALTVVLVWALLVAVNLVDLPTPWDLFLGK
jgi:hypothetical protein